MIDVLYESPSWHRTHAAGDFILYRPLLFLFLGLQYALFGYHFWAWQLIGLTVHIAAVLLLYSICRRMGEPWAFLVSALFACSFLGSELVIWNHLTAYVLFAALALWSLKKLLAYVETREPRSLYASTLLACAASFVYELGLVFCALAAAACLCSRRRAGLIFLLVPVVYISANLADYYRVFGSLPHGAMDEAMAPAAIYTVLGLVWKQIQFWIGGFILPSIYNIGAQGRATFMGYSWRPVLGGVNALGLALFFGGLMSAARRVGLRSLMRGVPAILFLLAYSGIIALGRSVPRGIEYTLRINIYYAYVPVLCICVCLALISQRESPGRVSTSLAAGLVLLAVVNAVQAHRLIHAYRYEYSAPRLRMLDELDRWTHSPIVRANAFYVVAENCPGNDELPWFKPHFRRGEIWSETPRLADALYPERSYPLNSRWLKNAAVDIEQIQCTGVAEQDIRRAVVSSNLAGFPPQNLVDRTPEAWGSAETMEDTYAGVELKGPDAVTTLEITLFTPAGRAHLRDIRVVVADSSDGNRPLWRPVRARLSGAAFTDRVTVPPGQDGSIVTVEVEPGSGKHRYWGVACFSQSMGDQRNYLGAGGKGIYMRELRVR